MKDINIIVGYFYNYYYCIYIYWFCLFLCDISLLYIRYYICLKWVYIIELLFFGRIFILNGYL